MSCQGSFQRVGIRRRAFERYRGDASILDSKSHDHDHKAEEEESHCGGDNVQGKHGLDRRSSVGDSRHICA